MGVMLQQMAALPASEGGGVSGDAVVSTQIYAEVLAQRPGTLRGTQSYAEVLAQRPGTLRGTQSYIEIIRSVN